MSYSFKKYIGLPYKNLGRDFSGVDCFGLIHLLFKEELGIILPDYTDLKYNKEWYKIGENHILDSINQDWEQVVQPYKRFDCPIFYINSTTIANHIGVFTSPQEGKFLHILENSTSMLSRLDTYYKSHLYGVIRFSGISSL